MSLIPYVVACAGIAVFIIAVLGRIRMFASMPMHIRWELYPVPHEGERAKHGGSYLEDVDWWLKPRHKSKVAEYKAVAEEVAFLVALRKHNRPMWRASFPFHFGLYLVIAATVLMAALPLANSVVPGAMGIWRGAIVVTGAGGLALGTLGALGLLKRRLTAPELADFTTPADLFNLAFFVVAFGCALVTFAAFDQDFALVSAFVRNLLTLRFAPVATGTAGLMVGVTVTLLALLLAYIPLTHMSHFVAKFFAYHSIRWMDEPNLPGGPQEAAIAANLGQKVTWAASHIQSFGQKNWVEVATMDPKDWRSK
jgi:nitrate reductase gamma subunit